MAAATITNEKWGKMLGLDVYCFRTTTAANGEDGVTKLLEWAAVDYVFINGFAASKGGPFFSTYSSGTLTLYATAGTAGDSAAICVMVVGHQ